MLRLQLGHHIDWGEFILHHLSPVMIEVKMERYIIYSVYNTRTTWTHKKNQLLLCNVLILTVVSAWLSVNRKDVWCWDGEHQGCQELRCGRVYDRFRRFSGLLKLAGRSFISANSIECSWPLQWNQLIPWIKKIKLKFGMVCVWSCRCDVIPVLATRRQLSNMLTATFSNWSEDQ